MRGTCRLAPLLLFAGFALLSLSAAALVASGDSSSGSADGSSDRSWLHKVPDADRARANPFAGEPQAISAGRILFDQNCAHCHGTGAQGKHGRPSLRSERVAQATDGELAWLLRNGSLAKGMPTWSALPEPERWQIIAYLRSLPRDATAVTGSRP